MRQELIDLLLGELEPDRAAGLKARLDAEPELARELKELEALFQLMRRGEEIEPSPAMDRAVGAAAAKSCRPSLWARVRQVPGLVRYRARHSVAFRAAAIALAVHVLAMAILFMLNVKRTPGGGLWPFDVPQPEIVAQEPAPAFVRSLELRRLPHKATLAQLRVEGHEQTIRRGLEGLLATQRPDGAFGDPVETAWAALALLAEGDCSVSGTLRGDAIRRAIPVLLAAERAHGAILAALVEDYALSFEGLRPVERLEYAAAIHRQIREVGDTEEISREALALAKLADFGVPAGRDLGDAAILLGGDRKPLLARKPSRLSATVVLARGHHNLDREQVRAWARPLFEQAIADLSSGKVSGVVLLTLQAPYRL